jgi:hypothetical protein
MYSVLQEDEWALQHLVSSPEVYNYEHWSLARSFMHRESNHSFSTELVVFNETLHNISYCRLILDSIALKASAFGFQPRLSTKNGSIWGFVYCDITSASKYPGFNASD